MASAPDTRSSCFVAKICPSSWVSWASYGMGMSLALTPASAQSLMQGGVSAAVMGTAILMFFLSASLIQRFMALSLLSSSYGQPKTLTTGGIFGVTRNPIYCAFLIPLASIAYLNVGAAALAIGVYLWAMTTFIIRREEACLREAFGAAYEAYSAKTPRWIGF